jgi:hypothetical protein
MRFLVADGSWRVLALNESCSALSRSAAVPNWR